DAYLNGQVATATNFANQTIPGGIKITRTGLLYITTANQATGDLTNAELAVVNNHGVDIANYVNGGGGLWAQAETPFNFPNQPKVASFGWLTSLFPNITVNVPGGFGNTTGPNAIQITPVGQAAFPGLTVADLSTGPWHTFFSGVISPLAVAVTDLDRPPSDP